MDKKFTRSAYYGKLTKCRADCDSSIYAHGLCGKHYQRQKRNGDFNKVIKVNVRHGLSKHPLYNTWKSMLDRCYVETSISYHNYGGRGITVCAEWHSVENFIKDMGDRPTPEHELDRTNTDGNYEPSNCKWSTKVEQAYNRRNVAGVCWDKSRNKWISYFGGKSTGGQITKYFNNKVDAINFRKEQENNYAK